MTRVDAGTLVAGGTVQAGGGVYLERRADAQLLAHCRAGEFTYVLTSRQMGKSSLMIRTAGQLKAEGVVPVIIDLTEFGAQTTAEQWYKGLLLAVQDQAELRTPAAEWWNAQADDAISHRFTRYLREVALVERAERIVIFVDEIDTTLRLTFTDDFFAGIRFLYQNRAADPALERLSFVLLGVATPGDLIKDPARTPFNIGHRLELSDFTVDEALPLAAHLSVAPALRRDLTSWIVEWTGGHPYLTLSLMRSLADHPPEIWDRPAVDSRVRELFLRAGAETDSNLQFVRDMLTKKAFDREAVLRTYADVRRGRRVPNKELDQVVSWLKLSGVVRARDGLLQVRNAVYERVFDERWTREHLQLSVDWRRRLTRVGAALLVLTVAVTIPLAFFAWRQKTEAEFQARRAQVERDEATRQRVLAENSLAERTAALKSLQAALDELRTASPTGAAIAKQVERENVQAQAEYNALTTQLRNERDDALRRLEAATGKPAASRPPAAATAPAANTRPAPPKSEAVPGRATTPPPRPNEDVEAIRRLFRRYEAAFAARDIAALQRVQVLPPADVAGMRDTFAQAAVYQVRIYSESISVAPDGKSATTTAGMDRSITRSSRLFQDTTVPHFQLAKQAGGWMIVGVSVDMRIR